MISISFRSNSKNKKFISLKIISEEINNYFEENNFLKAGKDPFHHLLLIFLLDSYLFIYNCVI